MVDPSPILTVIFPSLFGLTFIAVSALGCRMRAQHRRLVGLEMRVGALEAVPPPRVSAPVYQMPPSAPPMMDPMPPASAPPIGMPTVAAVAQMQRYTGYI